MQRTGRIIMGLWTECSGETTFVERMRLCRDSGGTSGYDSPGFHVAGIWKPLYWLWTLQFCLSHMYLFYYAGYFL